jgi:hypothetical protein
MTEGHRHGQVKHRWITRLPTRISTAAERDPDSPPAQGGFDDRAQDAAALNDPDDE